MPDSLLSPAQLADLETLIDAKGLPKVLEALAAICGEKADHINSNWQDRHLAKRWQIAGSAIDKLSASAVITFTRP